VSLIILQSVNLAFLVLSVFRFPLGSSVSFDLHTILKQNYFEYQETIYHLSKGVAMGSPVSGTKAEILLQHIENKHIKQLLDSKIMTFS
jgi:hypothetical protein